MRNKQGGPISAFIGGTVFLAIGGALAYFWGWPMIVEAKASRSWSSTPGTINVSKVESHRDSDNRRMYSHHIQYTFTVDGVKHTGHRVWVSDGASSSSPSSAQRTVSRYPVGKETAVYFDPAAPDVCALNTGATWMTYMPFGFGGLFFVVGALLVGGSLFKLVVGTLMIGAAATTAIGKSVVPTRQNHQPMNDLPRSTSEDDDGITIT